MYSVTGETAISPHLVAKNELDSYSFRPMQKDQEVGRQYANVSVSQCLGFVLKTTRFNDSESTLSFERQFYTQRTFRFQTLQDVFFH